jgi:hypothetical protein
MADRAKDGVLRSRRSRVGGRDIRLK